MGTPTKSSRQGFVDPSLSTSTPRTTSSTSATPSSGGLFGGSATSITPSSGLFGGSATFVAPSGGLFGGNLITRAASPTNKQLNSSLNKLSLDRPSSTNTNQLATKNSDVSGATKEKRHLEGPGSGTERQPINNGTGSQSIFCPLMEKDPYTNSAIFSQTITYTHNLHFSAFSLEELRVADYAQGRKSITLEVSDTSFLQWGPPVFSRGHTLQLLKGPNIRILIDSETNTTKLQESWCLPKSLVSYHSPLLKAACHRDFYNKGECQILLPHEDTKIFSLFVEWMYYGEYTSFHGIPNGDAKAWGLGDKLMSPAFKNYAMGRIYDAHNIDNLFGTPQRPVTTDVVAFACKNTAEGAKLRRFYIDFTVTHFSNLCKVTGTTEAWDSIMMDFGDLRIALLTTMRSSNQLSRIGIKESYMETMSSPNAKH